MRLCRFQEGEDTLLGFFWETHIIPIDSASEAFSQATEEDLDLIPGDDPLELLPPSESAAAALRLYQWLETLNDADREAISVPIDQVSLRVPIRTPGKLLLLAGNYAKHVEERGGTTAEREETFPYVFWKPPTTTLTDPGDPIVLPANSPDYIDWECELGVVIGSHCKNVSEAEALDYVAGYTVINDISDRKFTPNPTRKTRERDKFFDWLHGKWHDTFCPLGPCLLGAEGVDPQALHLTLKVNGETKQDASTAQMVFPVAAVVAFISSFTTLEPGDVISTGTPSGVGSATGTYLKHGDEIEASIERIGTLRNWVTSE
jgi:2,4-diketo-3-deoxy-L-fuconate hydrolase